MKTLIITFVLFLSFTGLANDHIEKMYTYYVTYDEEPGLSTTETKVLISCGFSSDDPSEVSNLRYGLNGSDLEAPLTEGNQLIITPAAGKYVFQFYYSSRFREIETDSIKVETGLVTHIHLYFQEVYDNNIRLKKPVIYLYPETATSVSVNLNTKGLAFTYPLLNDGWKVVAQPDGTLSCGGKNYPYLFWDADQHIQNPFETNMFEGFVVEGKNAVAFLEEQLTQIGFNDRERTDFITFWGPQLAANDFNNITFVFNEACDVYGTLDISPKPQHVNRVYMIWGKADGRVAEGITPQELPALDRSGFDVMEWGGMEVDNLEL